MHQTKPKSKKKLLYANAHWYFGAGLLIIITGFFKSYFSNLSANDAAHHVHGIAALLWMLMLIVQPLTFSRGKLPWHRIIGKVSFVLVPVVIVTALHIVQLMILGKAHYPPLAPYQLAFIDLFSLCQFALFYIMAIVTRKKLHLHARYMAATVFLFIIPGLGRALLFIPGINSFDQVVNISLVLTDVVLLFLIWDDKRSGQFRLPYILAFVLFAVQLVGYNTVGHMDWWVHLMDGYAKL
jgi:hypothetical protein